MLEGSQEIFIAELTLQRRNRVRVGPNFIQIFSSAVGEGWLMQPNELANRRAEVYQRKEAHGLQRSEETYFLV